MKRDDPIIPALTYLDLYKITTLYFAWKFYPEVQTEFAWTNRTTNMPLAKIIDMGRLRQEFNHIKSLKFSDGEIAYLRDLNLFEEDFLTYLKTFRMSDFELGERDGQIEFRVGGSWLSTSLWETTSLTVGMTMSNHAQMEIEGVTRDDVTETGRKRLSWKNAMLLPHQGIRLIEFGTRRPFDPEWQEEVLITEKEVLGGMLVGTSNVYLARKLGLTPKGTFPHEPIMILAGVLGLTDQALRESVMVFMDQWLSLYGDKLAIALTDTFGSKSFFDDLGQDRARRLKGYRVDSMEPITYGEELIARLLDWEIDPMTQLLVPSDSLTAEKIVEIYLHFVGRIMMTFGWGGNFVNDMGLSGPNLVMKAIRANSRPLVKLSDVLGKHMSPSKRAINRFKRVFV